MNPGSSKWARAGLLMLVCIVAGCEMVTVPNPPPQPHSANRVVINKVFVLPPSQYYSYCWVEIFNATSQRIGGLRRWTLTYSLKARTTGGVDTTFRIVAPLRSPFSFIPDTLEPNSFLVLTSDSLKLIDHTDIGSGRAKLAQFAGLFQVLPGQFTLVPFTLQETDQLYLCDTAGVPVDVVRYGNYALTPTDSLTGNVSAGVIPEWSALARYAGAYFTGNTANDFYMEPNPVPGWYNARGHP